MGTPSMASASSAAACSLTSMATPTLGSAGTATPAGSPWSRTPTGLRATPSTAPTGSATGGTLWQRGHLLRPVRARQAEGLRRRVHRRPLQVQRRGLRAGRPALACADSAGRPGRGAPRSPSPPAATRPPTDRSNRPMDRPARFAPRRRWRPPWPPRCTSIPHAVAGGCAT
jgi:hypothetical protein